VTEVAGDHKDPAVCGKLVSATANVFPKEISALQGASTHEIVIAGLDPAIHEAARRVQT
jgi:hypothetical protein